MTEASRRGTVGLVLILGIINCASPLAVDMYLPAFSAIGTDLHADLGTVQMTFSVFALSSGLAPLLYGPLSDRYGRRGPILLGMIGYIVSSLLCSRASGIGTLLFWRGAQGATSAVAVLSLAVVRDLYRGHQALQLIAAMMLIQSVSPLLAPAIGSAVIAGGSWRLIFLVLCLPGVLALVIAFAGLPETLPAERRSAGDWSAILSGYREVMSTRHFLVPALIGAAALATLHVYVASSSFVFMTLLRLTPAAYSLVFAIGALMMIAIAQAGAPLCRRYGTRRVVRVTSLALLGSGIAVDGLWLFPVPPLVPLLAGVWAMLMCVGILMPTSSILALEPFERNLGSASSTYNALRSLAGALAIALTGLAYDGSARPALIMLTVCGCAAAFAALALRQDTDRDGPSFVSRRTA